MNKDEIENDPELQRILWACYEFWQKSPTALDEREIWYRWVLSIYSDRFGASFHQAKLRRLARFGYLKQGDTARGGNRRYYKITDLDRVAILLRKSNLI